MTKNRLHRTGADDYPAPWEDRPVSEARWQHHREAMIRNAGPGRRPVEWWLYDKGWSDRPDLHGQTAILLQMGELTKAELAQLMVWWRMDFEDAYGDYVEAQERRERLRGIPRPILAQLRAERKRRARTVRTLAEAPAEPGGAL